MHKLFENYSKCRIWILEFWHFPPIFVLLKVTCLAIVFDRKLQIFKNSPKWTIIGIFNQLSSIQNVSIARNVEWDFSVIFKHREVQFCLLQLHKTGCWIQWQINNTLSYPTLLSLDLAFLRHSMRKTTFRCYSWLRRMIYVSPFLSISNPLDFSR